MQRDKLLHWAIAAMLGLFFGCTIASLILAYCYAMPGACG